MAEEIGELNGRAWLLAEATSGPIADALRTAAEHLASADEAGTRGYLAAGGEIERPGPFAGRDRGDARRRTVERRASGSGRPSNWPRSSPPAGDYEAGEGRGTATADRRMWLSASAA